MESEDGGFLLADGTGFGKTRQQLAVAQTWVERGHPVLIVAPSSVLNPDQSTGYPTGSWADDSALLGITLTPYLGDEGRGTVPPLEPGRIYITNYHRMHNFESVVDGNTVLIFDEAHTGRTWKPRRRRRSCRA